MEPQMMSMPAPLAGEADLKALLHLIREPDRITAALAELEEVRREAIRRVGILNDVWRDNLDARSRAEAAQAAAEGTLAQADARGRLCASAEARVLAREVEVTKREAAVAAREADATAKAEALATAEAAFDGRLAEFRQAVAA